MELRAVIPNECYGKRLDVVLAQLFPQYSRSQLTQWLKSGHISMQPDLLRAKDKVAGGERISIDVPQSSHSEAMAEDIALDIVHEDEDVLIINKPQGLVVHPGAGNRTHTLLNALLHHEPTLSTLPRAGIIHRLDKDTTGLLIVAKTLIAYTALSRDMQLRQIHRRYVALVYGHVVSGGIVETLYGRDSKNRLKMAVTLSGKEAITEYRIKEFFHDFTLLDIQLHTGRTHQIRVHMTHLHHPLVGDSLYGKGLRFPKNTALPVQEALRSFKRQALHAYGLTLTHPLTEQSMTFEIPLPADFQQLITLLKEYNL